MVWVLSLAHGNEQCRNTTQTGRQNNRRLKSSPFAAQCWSTVAEWDVKALPHHPFRVFFKPVWFYTIYSLSPQHKQVNDELVQSSRNLVHQFCHQRKYVSYETQIHIFFLKTNCFVDLITEWVNSWSETTGENL